MAKFVRFKNFPFSQASKRFLFHFNSFASSYSSLDQKDSHHIKQDYVLSNRIKDKALYFLNSCKSLAHIFQIQAFLITSDLFQDPSFSGRLLKLSADLCDDFYYTVLIFRCINCPDTFCVNRIIKHYSCSSYYEETIAFYIEMLKESRFYPNNFTFPPLISACAKMNFLSLGQMCQGQTVKFGVDGVLPVQNSLIHFYACCKITDVAMKTFVEMPIKDLVSWNTIIDGFVKAGEMDEAHKLFDSIPERNEVSWNVMIGGYLNFQNPGIAMKLFRNMMKLGFKSNDTTMVNVLTACGRSNRLKEGRSVHGFLLKSFKPSSLNVDSAIIHMYSKCRRVDHAQIIFNRMSSKNLVSWNVMILGHCIHGNPIDGLNLYSEMVDNSRTLNKLTPNSDKNLNLYEKDWILPDEITFIGVLCACARKGMLNEGRNYFSQMIDVFHAKPNFAHYWCMANLMASVGQVQEAVDLLKDIPTETYQFPESSLWAGLFASCRFQGAVNLGEQVAKDLIEQDPQNFSYYALLVNIYAVSGRWEEVNRAKDMMKKRGISRMPGCNLKDLKEVVHTTLDHEANDSGIS
ncbi:pentatricopeptide repeat-containing protein At3g51320-like [Primulina eburnea]|uniref:pentatricopeptide repeat-containing protein At3g51320-like n=1 Tax=Primulina eburnea TaxID=1245227 RepID=UPI003C6BE7E0